MSLFESIRAIKAYDPAARSFVEVLLCYPGLHALYLHRIAHFLFKQNIPLVPRLLNTLTRFLTGIDIHPGAQIGKRVVIDHGMGLVIGETAIVGDDCILYQGVTLGGVSLSKGKRHPTLEHHVVVGAGAKVLGNIVIGHHSKVGAGSVAVKACPPHSTIVGIPGKIAADEHLVKMLEHCLDHDKIIDSDHEELQLLKQKIEMLEKKMALIEQRR